MSDANWRAEVYAYQHAGKVDKQFARIASNFGKGAKVWLARPDVPAERQLIDDMLDGCEFHNITSIPPVAMVQTPIVNAASVGGRGIFFTTGIMQAMPPQQIRAVMGHELGHHRNVLRDTPVLLGIEATISYGMREHGISFQNFLFDKIKKYNRFKGAAALMVGGILDISAISMIFTPWRWFMELDSDKDGAAFAGTRNMGDALESLKRKASDIREKRDLTFPQQLLKWAGQALQFILNPLGSHPPIDYRIRRMRNAVQKLPAVFPHAPPSTPYPMPQRPSPSVHLQDAEYEATLSSAQALQVI